jgi:hypothetical protein
LRDDFANDFAGSHLIFGHDVGLLRIEIRVGTVIPFGQFRPDPVVSVFILGLVLGVLFFIDHVARVLLLLLHHRSKLSRKVGHVTGETFSDEAPILGSHGGQLIEVLVTVAVLVNNRKVASSVQGIVKNGIEPVDLARSGENILPAVEQIVGRVNKTVQRIKAVGNGLFFRGARHCGVLEALSKTVEPRGGGLGVDLNAADFDPDGVGTSAGPSQAVVGHNAVGVEHAEEALAVDLFEVVAGLVDALPRVAGHNGGIGHGCERGNTKCLFHKRVHFVIITNLI